MDLNEHDHVGAVSLNPEQNLSHIELDYYNHPEYFTEVREELMRLHSQIVPLNQPIQPFKEQLLLMYTNERPRVVSNGREFAREKICAFWINSLTYG